MAYTWLLNLTHFVFYIIFILYIIFISYPIFLWFQFSYLLCHISLHVSSISLWNGADFICKCLYWGGVYLPIFLKVGNLCSDSGKTVTLNKVVYYSMTLLYQH